MHNLKQHTVYSLALIIVFGLTSCFPKNNFPPEPEIDFRSFTPLGDSAQLAFNFTDGDGDIGLDPGEVQPPYDTSSFYHYNLYITYYEKNDGVWEPGLDLEGDSVVFRYRIKNFDAVRREDGLEGYMTVFIAPFYYNPLSPNSDTIRYNVLLIDRSLNESNILTTPQFTRP